MTTSTAITKATPMSLCRQKLAAELRARRWLSPLQVEQCINLFEWYADTPADEAKALWIVMENIRLFDQEYRRKMAGGAA